MTFKLLEMSRKMSLVKFLLIKKNDTNQFYAVKVIKYSIGKAIFKQMINHEVSIIIRIQNPTLTKFCGYLLEDFKSKQNVTIFMEYLEKGTLSDYLKST